MFPANLSICRNARKLSVCPRVSTLIRTACEWTYSGGMAKDERVKYIKEIQELHRRNEALAKWLGECKKQVEDIGTQSALKAKPNSTEPLSRSSMEAYIGIALGVALAVFPMIWWTRIPLFLLLCFVCVDFCWRLPLFLKLFGKPIRIGLCLLVFGVLVWAGKGNISKAFRDEQRLPDAKYALFWGSFEPGTVVLVGPSGNLIVHGTAANKVIVNGELLKRYSENYKLRAACFFWDGMQDIKDVSRTLSISAIFDIVEGPIPIGIPWSRDYLEHMAKGETNITFVLILVPKSMEKESFGTLREAESKGAIVIILGGSS
jgi:hypothetical protein